ncbi:MAG: tetratricopeptide repeat protein [Pseudomonadota bacterium]
MLYSICQAQYVDEESCTALSDIQIPELSEEIVASDSVNSFKRQLKKLNQNFPEEYVALGDGWLYLVLAECYHGGTVVDENRDIANTLLRVAASEGNSQAAHIIASIDVFQSDDPERQRQGFEHLESEYSNTGSAYAAGKIGWAYQKGLGVEQDISRALELYNFAAERGMTYWQYLLAHAYERGYLGLEADDERAEHWRSFKPKIHVVVYECWVAVYYADGTFPENEELHAEYQEICDNTDIADVWEQ